jgi:phage tail sheath gpL-like
MLNHSITPWKTTRSFSHEYIRNIKDAQGELIAQVCELDDGLNETIANARLMAAAPELLAALQGMIEYFVDYSWDDYSDTETLQAARAAIAKATGDQTA